MSSFELEEGEGPRKPIYSDDEEEAMEEVKKQDDGGNEDDEDATFEKIMAERHRVSFIPCSVVLLHLSFIWSR